MPLIEYKDRHQLPMRNVVAVFDHMAQTGGYTLYDAPIRRYGEQSVMIMGAEWLHASYDEMIRKLDAVRFVCGHGARGAHAFFPKTRNVFYFTLLRHPFKHYISRCKSGLLLKNRGKTPEYISKKLEYSVFNAPENPIINWFGNGDPALAERILYEQYAFLGITEFLAESIDALGRIFPCMTMEKVIYNKFITPKRDDITVGKLAEEHFLEKNSKDMELYDKAVREFKKRMINQTCDVELRTDERSYANAPEVRERKVHEAETFLNRVQPVHPSLLYHKYAALGNSDEQWGNFYDAIRKYNLPQYAFYEFACSAKLRRNSEMNAHANSLFDILDRMDGQNRVAALIVYRLRIVDRFIRACSDMKERSFFERCRGFLASLREMPEWRLMALDAETILLEECGELDAALASANNAVEMMPDSLEAHENLCRLLLKTGAVAKAERNARNELLRNPDSEWALRQLARVLQAKSEQQEAVVYLQKALEKNPCWYEGQKLFPKLFRGMDFHRASEISLRGYLEWVPDSMMPLRTDLTLLLARRLEERGEIDAAVAEIRLASHRDPGVVTFREFLTALLIRHGRIADAEKEARESAKMFPGLGWPFLQLSLICEARDDIAQGLEYARKGYALQQEKLSLAANYARFLRLAGEYGELEDFCRKAIDEDAGQGWPWRELCRMADARGDRGGALEMGAKAIAAHPEDDEFKRHYNTLLSGATSQ